ncbi:sugar transferase [Brachybacterium hainanense]|uniref:Sugar transferase n=1 Tax=Brachybacterium hainanense TaxID=1541174 RepID=A0ABV6RA89_9MICO
MRRTTSDVPSAMYERAKRVGDVLAAGGALLALWPLILEIAVLVRWRLGPGVLFRQARPGRHGEEFTLLKFRTMHHVDPVRGRVTDEDRMTTLGRGLRSTSLDELPSLVNVLRGQMSLVGPRPLRIRYLERYSQEQSRRHEVLPGLTGLAQISGRNAVSWDDRLALDVEYVQRRGPATDLRILLATVPALLRREGIAEEGRATMSDFFGPRRIGGHALHRDGAGWSVRTAGSGEVLARCALRPLEAGSDTAELAIDVCVDGSAAPEVRSRAAEMMLGVAREEGFAAIRMRLPDPPAVAGPPADGPWARLGFRPVPGQGSDAPILMRSLAGSLR